MGIEEGWIGRRAGEEGCALLLRTFISLYHPPPHPITQRFGVEVSHLRAELKEAKETVSK